MQANASRVDLLVDAGITGRIQLHRSGLDRRMRLRKSNRGEQNRDREFHAGALF